MKKPDHILSKHLFWDVNAPDIDFEKSKKWIIKRVLGYGLLADLLFIFKYYGLSEVAETAITIKDLDKRTATLIALLSDTPEEKFECLSTKQSNPAYCNFLSNL